MSAPTTWRLFEPCLRDDHADCCEEIVTARDGDTTDGKGYTERCACDCHRSPEAESEVAG